MGEPNASIIAKWLAIDGAWRQFKNIRTSIVDVLSMKLANRSPEQLAEISEKVYVATIKELESLANFQVSSGIEPRFILEVDGDEAYIKFRETPEDSILDKLRLVHPKDFEDICRAVLIHMGGSSIDLKTTHDGGVDFIALNLTVGNLRIVPRTAKITVIGQAKRWKHKMISEPTVRDFVGAAVKRANDLRIFYSDSCGGLSPVILAFWTTSDFNQFALKYASAIGIWQLSGTGLAQLLAKMGINIDEYAKRPPVKSYLDSGPENSIKSENC